MDKKKRKSESDDDMPAWMMNTGSRFKDKDHKKHHSHHHDEKDGKHHHHSHHSKSQEHHKHKLSSPKSPEGPIIAREKSNPLSPNSTLKSPISPKQVASLTNHHDLSFALPPAASKHQQPTTQESQNFAGRRGNLSAAATPIFSASPNPGPTAVTSPISRPKPGRRWLTDEDESTRPVIGPSLPPSSVLSATSPRLSIGPTMPPSPIVLAASSPRPSIGPTLPPSPIAVASPPQVHHIIGPALPPPSALEA